MALSWPARCSLLILAAALIAVAAPGAPGAPGAPVAPAAPVAPVAPAAAAAPAAPAVSADEAAVWASAASCRAVVAGARHRLAGRGSPARLRLGAWNIEWFPDHTDIAWLACAIAWLDVDLLAVSEMRDNERARARLAELLSELARLTGAVWQADLQRCGPAASQHTGFLWNAERLRLAAADDVWALNARARGPEEPCAGWLRPGRHGYFLPARGGGPGFHAIAVHLKSGATPEDAAERGEALARLGQAMAALKRDGERVVLLGDFNSMGDGLPGSAEAEVEGLYRLAAAAEPALAAPLPPACSEYYRARGGRRGEGGLLDHVLASGAMGAVAAGSARVSGYCALAGCAPISPWVRRARPAAYLSLSDHCPVVLELGDAMLSRTMN